MTPIDFLRVVLPDAGIYCIATPYPRGGMNHRVFDTIDDAAKYCDKVSGTENVYFATHALKAERIWNAQHHKDKNTGAYVAGWSVRMQKNMRACRTLFFDLDVGPPDPDSKTPKYGTQLEAAAALVTFVQATNLPRPMIVSSGYGLHVYWVLDRALDSATEWLTMARRLKQLANHYKLKYDPSRTTDSASVLRVAGTFNHKNNSKKLVDGKTPSTTIAVEDMEKAILAALAEIDVTPKPQVMPVVEGLGNNTKKTGLDIPPPPMRTVIQVCPQMRRLAELKGCNDANSWYWGDIGVVLYTQEGAEGVHKISSAGGYKGYSRIETDTKIDQWRAKNSGPTRCATLADKCGPSNEHICTGCKFAKDNTSPIWIAHLHDKAPPPTVLELVGTELIERTIPDPPMPYKRDPSGGISMLMESKDGKQYNAPIYAYDLHPLERAASKEAEQQHWRAKLPHGVIKDFVVEASTFVDDRALASKLANNGVYSSRFTELKAYMSAYIQELQRLHPITSQNDHLGWVDDDKFIMPDKVIIPGTTESCALHKNAASVKTYVSKKGTLQEQIRLLHFFDDPEYVANQFYILASLASPILKFTGYNGAIIHAAGEPGASKSTALYTAASFWGPPKQYTIDGTDAGSTPMFRAQRRDVLSNLPLCIDEITHMASDVARSFTMNATQAKNKGRLKQDGTEREGQENERASITMTTANRSLHALIANDNAAGTAAAVRVFEIAFRETKKVRVHEVHEADEFLRGIMENYGHLGEQMVFIIVNNRELVKKRVIATMKRLGINAKVSAEERFWFAVAATILVIGEIAVKRGYIAWDMAAMEHWLITTQLPLLRGTVKEEAETLTPLTVLTNYLEIINGHLIKAFQPPPGGNLGNVLQVSRGEMLGHYDLDTKMMYVLKDGFRRWCEKRGAYSQSVLRELHTRQIVTLMDTKRTLGYGTDHAKGRSLCFVVDMNHADISGVQLALVNQPPPVLPTKPTV